MEVLYSLFKSRKLAWMTRSGQTQHLRLMSRQLFLQKTYGVLRHGLQQFPGMLGILPLTLDPKCTFSLV